MKKGGNNEKKMVFINKIITKSLVMLGVMFMTACGRNVYYNDG